MQIEKGIPKKKQLKDSRLTAAVLSDNSILIQKRQTMSIPLSLSLSLILQYAIYYMRLMSYGVVGPYSIATTY